MKLLNFSNLEFKWGCVKKIRFDNFRIYFECRFKYLFFHPISLYFEIDLDIKCYKNYHFDFINKFKYLKREITNETA